ncbi:hypothetical protein E4U54_004246 [Claviceps lovelessii]|nr:hypothetical protein E4U54_004246 [Claviceps lovelessii]
MCRTLVLLAAWVGLAAASNGPMHPPIVPDTVGKMLSPNALKAGSAGNRTLPFWREHIGWFFDGTSEPRGNDGDTGKTGPIAVPVLSAPHRAKHPTKHGSYFAHFREGFFEVPEWTKQKHPLFLLPSQRPERTGLTPKLAARLWRHQLARLRRRGTRMGSPTVLATQLDWWLVRYWQWADWQMTSIHIFEPDVAAFKKHIDHYWYWYGKQIWITEFGCRHDPAREVEFPRSPCNDQRYVNRLIRDLVQYFEDDDRIAAYAYPEENEWCELCAALDENEMSLTPAGDAYLRAIMPYSSVGRGRLDEDDDGDQHRANTNHVDDVNDTNTTNSNSNTTNTNNNSSSSSSNTTTNTTNNNHQLPPPRPLFP